MIEVYNTNNEKLKCEVLFTFEKNNKSYIIYKDEEDDILASYYKLEGDNAIISPITDESEYDLVDKEIEKWCNEDE